MIFNSVIFIKNSAYATVKKKQNVTIGSAEDIDELKSTEASGPKDGDGDKNNW